jgi:hypothetical protein
MGLHTFRYALLPHLGHARSRLGSEVLREAALFNAPLAVSQPVLPVLQHPRAAAIGGRTAKIVIGGGEGGGGSGASSTGGPRSSVAGGTMLRQGSSPGLTPSGSPAASAGGGGTPAAKSSGAGFVPQARLKPPTKFRSLAFFTVESSAGAGDCNVVLDTVKQAEDGSGSVVLRAYESLGLAAHVTITSGFPVKAVAAVNLLEEAPDAAGIPVEGGSAPSSRPPAVDALFARYDAALTSAEPSLHEDGTIGVKLRPFQIITLKLSM